ncbi:MAG: SPFH domain-containing protein [Eggerthellaceae bacterium]|nr:SPFH domain-containing protein [Eggerthellaceae bacterium]MDR2721660.1 SPFH domain-containing protein [Coriobacteriaceae bacterium]
MGFIQAFSGALTGMLADQWLDYHMVPSGISPTAGVFPAVKKSTDAGRGSNVLASDNIITNGSLILVPENTALLTFEKGAITGFIAEAGGYQYTTDSVAASSLFSGGGLVKSVIQNSWERFKFGGIPGDQQLAFYVNLKEIPNNKFGTQAPLYWIDSVIKAQVGAVTRGSYTLKITDPIAFVKNYVPVQHLIQDARPFDFAEMNHPSVEQLFNEVVQSLSAAFSLYTNEANKKTMMDIQGDSVGFVQSLSAAVEENYKWTAERGLTIVAAALLAIEYDEATRALFTDVQKADALMGDRGNSFLQQSVARGIQAAGEGEGGALGIGMMGMGLGAAGNMMGGLQQPSGMVSDVAANAAPPTGAPVSAAPAPAGAGVAPVDAPAAAPADDPYDKLTRLKGLLDSGVITQEDFDTAKSNLLGI